MFDHRLALVGRQWITPLGEIAYGEHLRKNKFTRECVPFTLHLEIGLDLPRPLNGLLPGIGRSRYTDRRALLLAILNSH